MVAVFFSFLFLSLKGFATGSLGGQSGAAELEKGGSCS